ncbi:hypothetical protein [Ahrensia sp. R2A130]|uniref:hypothetical protein n=1 Tax=Ahrensia sp. R2A130 TaxID=744979 RepID=UPI0012E9F405|nr:hypothetical protein [Ahrensia sp. R2A130]
MTDFELTRLEIAASNHAETAKRARSQLSDSLGCSLWAFRTAVATLVANRVIGDIANSINASQAEHAVKHGMRFGMLRGLKISKDNVKLEQGIWLEKIYFNAFAPVLASYSPAEKGKAKPSPWVALDNGIEGTAHCQLVVDPATGAFEESVEEQIWLIACVIRLATAPAVDVPYVSSTSFHPPSLNLEQPIFKVRDGLRQRFQISDSVITIDGDILRHISEIIRLLQTFEDLVFLRECMTLFDESCVADNLRKSVTFSFMALERIFRSERRDTAKTISKCVAVLTSFRADERDRAFAKTLEVYDIRQNTLHRGQEPTAEQALTVVNVVRTALMYVLKSGHSPDVETLLLDWKMGFEKSQS